MIYNISYKDNKQIELINNSVGKPYSLVSRIKIGGVGSPKYYIKSSDKKVIKYKLPLIDFLKTPSKKDKTCNIEMRPKGIIIRFRSLLETYALIIPYFKLSIFKPTGDTYSIHSGEYKIIIITKTETKRKFIKRILEEAKISKDYIN